MSSFFGIKVIAGLISIHLYLYKLSEKAQLRAHLLLDNHILRSLLKSRPSFNINSHHFLLDSLTSHQQSIIKGSVVDMDNRFNEVFPAFDLLNKKFSSGSRIVNSFSNQFYFHLFKRCSDETFKSQSQQLDNLTIVSSSDSSHALVVTDTSIKNNVATSIAYIHVHDKPVIKMIHHTVNVLTTEAELFAIMCGIN